MIFLRLILLLCIAFIASAASAQSADQELEELYDRINKRVISMMDLGLLDEVKRLYPKRHLPALNTVGYRELFSYINGETSLDEAIMLIQRNTRRYAKRQITWFSNQGEWQEFHPDQLNEINDHIRSQLHD